MKFQKGKHKTGGRPPGQQNKVTREIKAYAREVIENPAYQQKLKQRLLNGSVPQLEVLLHYYAYGKPKLEVELTDRSITVLVQREQPTMIEDGLPALPNRAISEAETV